MIKIGILNYNACNLRSVYNSIYRRGFNPKVIDENKDLKNFDKLIIPGVGSAFKSISYLKENGFFHEINNFLDKSKPVLGICLGLQLFCENLFEGGKSKGFQKIDCDVLPLTKKKTNVGWFNIEISKDISSKMNLKMISSFYFCHSFFLNFNNKNEKRYCQASIVEENIPCIILKDNFLGTQFHPEKSQLNGDKILNFFLNKF